MGEVFILDTIAKIDMLTSPKLIFRRNSFRHVNYFLSVYAKFLNLLYKKKHKLFKLNRANTFYQTDNGLSLFGPKTLKPTRFVSPLASKRMRISLGDPKFMGLTTMAWSAPIKN